jgi:hypothetical protein
LHDVLGHGRSLTPASLSKRLQHRVRKYPITITNWRKCVQDVVLQKRIERALRQRQEAAASLIQRSFQKFRMRKRHHAMINVVYEVRCALDM